MNVFRIAGLFILLAGVQVTAADKPNIVLILTDDQGWGDLSCNGNTNLNTPNIDQMAREGVTFDRNCGSRQLQGTRQGLY